MPVTLGHVGGVDGLVVDARQLHASLQVRREFAKWIAEKLAEYEFLDGVDFEAIKSSKMADQVSKPRAHGGDRRSEIVTLTLHTAKELAMLHRGPKGKLIRRYFVDCERRLLEQQRVSKETSAHNRKTGWIHVDNVELYVQSIHSVTAEASLAGYREFHRALSLVGPSREITALEMAEAMRCQTYDKAMDVFLLDKDANLDAKIAKKILDSLG